MLRFYRKYRLELLVAILLLFLFRVAVPYLKFAFIPLFAAYCLLFLFEERRQLHNLVSKRMVKTFALFILVAFLFLLALINSGFFTFYLAREAMHIMVFVIYILLLTKVAKGKEQFQAFKAIFIKYFAYSSAGIAVLAIVKFYFFLKGIDFEFLIYHQRIPWGISLVPDYNFFALVCILGLLSWISILYQEELSKRKRIVAYIAIFLLLTCTLLTGSRRGIFVTVLIIGGLSVFWLFANQIFVDNFRGSKKKSLGVLAIVLVTILVHISYLFLLSPNVRVKIAEAAGVNPIIVKRVLTKVVSRYFTIVDPKTDTYQVYEKLWCPELTDSVAIQDNSLMEELRTVFRIENADTTYNEASKVNQGLGTYGSRMERWLFGFRLFKEYSFFEKLIGSGFDYMQAYGERFAFQKGYHWPHSPVVAAFLYSGIIGGVIYLLFLIQITVLYVKNIRQNLVFALFFVVCSLFAMLSGNSHFSIPTFAFFSIFPFFIQYYKKNA